MKKYVILTPTKTYLAEDVTDVYTTIVEDIYGKDTRNVDLITHQKASEAQSWCGEPWGDFYEDDDFIIEIED